MTGLHLRKVNAKLDVNDDVCYNRKCGKAIQPIDELLLSYKDIDTEDLLVLGKNKHGLITTLFDKDMKVKQSNDSKTVTDYATFAHSEGLLKRGEYFSDQSDIGKARIAYRFVTYW